MNATTHMDYAYIGPYRAVKRSVQLFKTRVLLLDFVTGDLAHHTFLPLVCYMLGSFAFMTMLMKNQLMDNLAKMFTQSTI